MDSSRVTVLIIGCGQIWEEITDALGQVGFMVAPASSNDLGLHQGLGQPVELIIAEAPPAEDEDFIPSLRRITDAPIAVIGVHSGTEDLVRTVVQGADLYLQFPMDPQEFLARIYALIRRYLAQKPSPQPLHIQD